VNDKESLSASSKVADVEVALRNDYYYKPTLEELREKYIDGSVKIGENEDLTIGRLGYGKYFAFSGSLSK